MKFVSSEITVFHQKFKMIKYLFTISGKTFSSLQAKAEGVLFLTFKIIFENPNCTLSGFSALEKKTHISELSFRTGITSVLNRYCYLRIFVLERLHTEK